MAPSPASSSTKPGIAAGDSDQKDQAESVQRHQTRDAGMDFTTGDDKQVPPLSASWRNEPLADDERKKIQQVLEACRDRDYAALQALAASPGGLVEDEVRRTACKLM